MQKLLYDLEAGMPYMFLDQLVVQAPQTSRRCRRRAHANVDRGVGPVEERKMIVPAPVRCRLLLLRHRCAENIRARGYIGHRSDAGRNQLGMRSLWST